MSCPVRRVHEGVGHDLSLAALVAGLVAGGAGGVGGGGQGGVGGDGLRGGQQRGEVGHRVRRGPDRDAPVGLGPRGAGHDRGGVDPVRDGPHPPGELPVTQRPHRLDWLLGPVLRADDLGVDEAALLAGEGGALADDDLGPPLAQLTGLQRGQGVGHVPGQGEREPHVPGTPHG